MKRNDIAELEAGIYMRVCDVAIRVWHGDAHGCKFFLNQSHENPERLKPYTLNG